MFDPRALTEDPAQQRRLWELHLEACSARNYCPFSGEPISRCKRTDLCDCFAFPEHEHFRRLPT